MTDSTTQTNVYWINLLKGEENYAVWKIKMMDILTDQGYFDHVDGSSTLPNDTAAQIVWKKKDHQALSSIRLCVGDKMLVYIASAETAKAAWDTLRETLEQQGPLGIVLVRRKLF